MRVGVFVGAISPTEGGGNTLRRSIISAIQGGNARHDFIVFQEPETTRADQPRRLSQLRNSVGSLPVIGPAARRVRHSLRLARQPGELPAFEEQCLRSSEVDIAWFLCPVARPVAVPFIATVWDLEHRKQPYFPEVSISGWRWEDREQNFSTVLPRAARILTGTEAGKQEVIAFYGVRPENVCVVPHPAADQYRQAAGSDVRVKYGLRKPFLFYPAQFWPHKNHANLLLGLQQFNDTTDAKIDLVLTGADMGNLGYVRGLTDDLGLAGQVHFLGFVDSADVADLYHSATALIYPTLFGPDNLPPLEAFAAGCPVAASRIAGATEQLGEAAILFDPLDPADIARAISSLLDEVTRQEYVGRGRELVAQRTPANYVAQVCDILDAFEPIRRSWGRTYGESENAGGQ